MFTMCPNTYPTHEQKVLFVISLLRGPAFNWARDIPEQPDHPLRHDYPTFKIALGNLYLDRNLQAISEAKLSQLRQTKSAATYAVDFQSLSAPLDLNDGAKCLLFYQGLKTEVKDAIATVGCAAVFVSLVDQAISIDQRKHQRSVEDKKTTSSTTQGPPPFGSKPFSKPQSKPSSSSASANVTSSPAASSSGSTPKGPLSDAEKARRKQKGLCMYCGEPNHIWANCPRRLTHIAKVNSLPAVPPYTPTGPVITVQSGNEKSQVTPRSEA